MSGGESVETVEPVVSEAESATPKPTEPRLRAIFWNKYHAQPEEVPVEKK
jgi:hypothetical protein